MKTVAIIGSTGSIGTQALDVLRGLDSDFQVVALAANTNISKILGQIDVFKPRFVTMQDNDARKRLSAEIQNGITTVIEDRKPVETLIKEADADITLISVVGSAGLLPSLAAAKLGKRLALANKESLVLGGDLLIKECRRYNTEILPVDSEHSAIFQCLLGQDKREVRKIVLTASGGPFLNVETAKMNEASVEEALNHPTWDMGGKISIDSATMMNKGLEVIEAHYLFGIDYSKIKVLVHPQSLVHSYVEYTDGAIISQLGLADMRVPIQLAFTYPKRMPRAESLDLTGKTLEFSRPDLKKFPCLRLAYEAASAGGDRPVVLNAANEVAVKSFLSSEVPFGEISLLIEDALRLFPANKISSLEELLDVDNKVRDFTRGLIKARRC